MTQKKSDAMRKGPKPKARAAAKPKAGAKSTAKAANASKVKPKRTPKAEKPKTTAKSTPRAKDTVSASNLPQSGLRVDTPIPPTIETAPIAESPRPVRRKAPTLQERDFPTPSSRFRAFAMPARADRSDLHDFPTEGANRRFRFQFVYNGIHFVVRVLGKDARGVTLFMEGNLGFVPFSYEGQGLRLQLLEVLQFARKQKVVHINLVAEQRISLTSEILIKGPFNPNTAVSAIATRLARVKPLIDVIRTLQPYQREYSDGPGHYALERTSVEGNAESAA